jgi:DNA-binding PadR family transcriptional regulator
MFGFHRPHHPHHGARGYRGGHHCGHDRSRSFDDSPIGEEDMFGHRGSRHGEGSMRGSAGRTRLFAQGDLRLVVLALLQERPRHGYEVIKAIEERVGGDYSPSPGVIYPTLTLLSELGYARINAEEGERKQYAITEAGAEFLASQKATLDAVLHRLDQAGRSGHAMRAPEVQRALQNFRMALSVRLSRGSLSRDQIRAVVEAIDAAAVAIERS